MAHWHSYNPWAKELVYLTSLDEVDALTDESEYVQKAFPTKFSGMKFDAYLLRDHYSNGVRYHLGVRYGPEGYEYLSPYIRNEKLAEDLWNLYSPKEGN